MKRLLVHKERKEGYNKVKSILPPLEWKQVLIRFQSYKETRSKKSSSDPLLKCSFRKSQKVQNKLKINDFRKRCSFTRKKRGL